MDVIKAEHGLLSQSGSTAGGFLNIKTKISRGCSILALSIEGQSRYFQFGKVGIKN